MKKKIILISVITLISIFILAACGQAGTGASKTGGSSSASQKQTEASPAQSSAIQSLTDIVNSAKQVSSISLDFNVTTSDGKTASGTIYGETGKMIKIQTTVNGQQVVEIIDQTNKTFTMYETSTKKGEKMKEPAGMESSTPGSYLAGLDPSKVQDAGTDTVNGYACRVIQYTSPSDSNTAVKMWISTQLDFPVQITSTAGGKTTTIDYSNISTAALPAGTFDIPSDIKITTVQ